MLLHIFALTLAVCSNLTYICIFNSNQQSDTSHWNPESYDFNLNTSIPDQSRANADLTFKSFICPGGEVEIADASHSTEETIILPQDQATPNTCETDDLEISDNEIIQPCSRHVEHPYNNPEIRDAVQDPQEAFEDSVCSGTNVTWKSFVCDGGEVEVFDVTTMEDETIQLPVVQLDEQLQDQSVNPINLSDHQLQHVEHRDHPYCHSDVDFAVNAASSETTNGLEVSESRPSDLTFKSFNCTGGEVEVSDGTTLANETIPLPALQSGPFSEPHSFCAGASLLANHQDEQNNTHVDHQYCNVYSNLSIPDGEIFITEELSPVGIGALDEPDQSGLTVCNGPTNRQECGPSASLNNSALDASFQGQSQEIDKQFNSHLENNDAPVDLPLSQPASMNLESKSFNCQIQETLKDDRPEFSHSSHDQVSSEPQTPASAYLSNGHKHSPEDKDSALGSSGNEPVASKSAENHVENLTDVLKTLSECPSVASALQFGLLSPVVRRASLFLSGAIRAPAADELLPDDSTLEVEKSLLAPVNINTTGLWTEHMDASMPHPLLNSTALSCRPQPNPLTELNEDRRAPRPESSQTKVEKPVLGVPLIQDGPLQQQLRQMAEFLLLASGKIGPVCVSTLPQPPSVAPVPFERAPPAEFCSVATGTSPVRWANHSVNTSGQFERKREFSVADSCTLTDPLLWK